jgi:hypothetical protein
VALIDAEEISLDLMLSLHFVKKIPFVHYKEKRSSTMRILMNQYRILRPNSKLNSLISF